MQSGADKQLQADQGELSALRARNDELILQLEHVQQQNAHLAGELGTMSSENDGQASLVSGYITDDMRTEAARAGVREVLVKANVAEEFCDAVQRLLQRNE